MSRGRRGRRRLGAGLLVAAALVGANIVVHGREAQIDLSAAHRFSLSPETRALARAVRSPLKITAFLNTTGPQARDARFLLARYHEVNSHITSSVLDPDANPGAARRFGIGRYATVVVTYQGRRVDAPSPEELEVSTAILRLLRGGTKTICVLTGHGEAALDDASPSGLSQVAQVLRQNSYEPRVLDLTIGPGTVPADCAAVADIGPRDPYLPAETKALNAYTSANGRLMLLASPLSRSNPNPLISPWGIHFAGGLLLDPARSVGADAGDVVLQDFPSVNPVDDSVSSLQFPAGGGVLVDPSDQWAPGLDVAKLAQTSRQSWLESNPDVEERFDAGDLPGPVVAAAAADQSQVQPSGETRIPGSARGTGGAKINRTRVFVAGDDLWATNQFLGNLSNRRFFLNALNWLAEEEQLVATTSRPAAARQLPFTSERQTRVLLVGVGLMPGLILVTGVGVGLWRGGVRRGLLWGRGPRAGRRRNRGRGRGRRRGRR